MAISKVVAFVAVVVAGPMCPAVKVMFEWAGLVGAAAFLLFVAMSDKVVMRAWQSVLVEEAAAAMVFSEAWLVWWTARMLSD